MKSRQGFVSNSSTSSFFIPIDALSGRQRRGLMDVDADGWTITEDEEGIHGFTMMDNFDMTEVFKELNISLNDVEYR